MVLLDGEKLMIEFCETMGYSEAMLLEDADKTHTPLLGTFELLPLCNMSCKMCYVRQTREEMDAQGRMLTCDEWLRIAGEACEKGLLYLLLTGGEPLLYPEFKRLYTETSKMGILLEVNTNGTLIDEEWADFFCENGVKRINITLYGKDDATYGSLCDNPKGFTQVMRAAQLLKERNVNFRFTCSVTPDNISQLPELYEIARSFDVHFASTEYMFPGVHRGVTAQDQYRISPEQAVYAWMCAGKAASVKLARETLAKMEQPPRLKGLRGFHCRAGRSSFWVNWKGEIFPCGMILDVNTSLLEHSFEECWDYIIEASEKIQKCKDCEECEYQNLCQVCPAMCYTETGSTAGCPDYVCQITEHKVKVLRKLLADAKEAESSAE